MSTLQLLEEHPKVAALISDYYSEIMINSLQGNDFPEEFKNFVKEQKMETNQIVEMIEKNPRNLFDFFDDYGLIIEIGFMPELPMTGQFTYRINEELGGTTSSKRKDVDKYAVELAIEMLEEELTKSVSDKENS